MKPIAAAAAIFLGALVAASQSGATSASQSAGTKAASGETLYRQRCAMCHAIEGTGGKLGPDLAGVIGRRAGSTDYAYSPAMRASNRLWNETTLDAYLAAPTRALPGTKMTVSVPRPEHRRAIIGHLSAQP